MSNLNQQHNWQELIEFQDYKDLPQSLPGDWYGLFFEAKQKQIKRIYLRPLNEDYQTVFPKAKGKVLTFQRHLIDEEDKEYALDVLNLFNLTPEGFLSIETARYCRIAHTLNLLEVELSDEDPQYKLVKSLLKVLLLQLIKIQQKGFTPSEFQQKRVYLFLQLMEMHYQTQIKADFYAQRLGISEKRLNQILKEKLGKTAKQIIHQRQLTEIKRMLQTDTYSLKEIAFQLSFQSISNFNRFFKRYTGMSPSVFRDEMVKKG